MLYYILNMENIYDRNPKHTGDRSHRPEVAGCGRSSLLLNDARVASLGGSNAMVPQY
jgi:hypothetical protein